MSNQIQQRLQGRRGSINSGSTLRHYLSTYLPIYLFSLLLISACTGSTAQPIPTRAPAPTFTPTVEVQPTAVDPAVVAAAQTAAAEQSAQQQPAAQATQPAQEEAPAATDQPPAESQPTATTEPPTNTPAPTNPEVVVISGMNVRQGPGTNYAVLGAANAGERFAVTGKNQSGDWWQINFNGQSGWVFGQLVTAANTQAVAVAVNIPAPPPPTNTPVPPPAAPTNPPPVEQAPTPAPAAPKYKFNVVVVSKCLPQAGGNWFEGKTYVNGQPQNGYKVVFSFAPDGARVTEPMISGPHPGYTNWDTGYYSHVIHAGKPEAGNWFAWIVDDNGARISDIGNFSFKGPGGDCNQVAVDFDSR